MKKFYSFVTCLLGVMLLAFTQAVAQNTDSQPLGDPITSLDEATLDKTYVLYNAANDAYVAYDADHAPLLWPVGPTADGYASFDATSANTCWMLAKSEDGSGYYLYNVACKQYLTTPGWNGMATSCKFSSDPVVLQVEKEEGSNFSISATGEGLDYMCISLRHTDRPISIWAVDQDCYFQLKENPNVPYDKDFADKFSPSQPDVFAVASIDPANGSTVPSLKKFTLTMNGDTSGNYIGGFDATKQILLKNAQGQTVTTAAIASADPNVTTSNEATVTLADEVTEEGAYTLIIPAATIYDKAFDASAADKGVSAGATYNPDYTYAFTVEKGEKPLGDPLVSLDEATLDKTYVLYNEANSTYLSYYSGEETKIWPAGPAGFPSFDPASANTCWMVAKAEDGSGYYVYNVANKKYLSTPGWPDGVALACRFADEASVIKVVDNGNGNFAFSSTGIEKDFVCVALSAAPATPQDGARPITIWTSDDAGGQFQLMENPNVPYDKDFADKFTPAPQYTITWTPAPGHYEAMPNKFKVQTDGVEIDPATVSVGYRVSGATDNVQLEDANIAVDADSVVFTLPTEVVYNKASLDLSIVMKDMGGRAFTYGDSEGLVKAQYTADIKSDLFTIASVDPADGSSVEKLGSFTLTMGGAEDDYIGGFDEEKAILLQDATGQTVTTGTIAYADPDVTTSKDAIVTLSEEVTAEGAYTLVIPSATIYDKAFDATAEDKGVSAGAIYNPEQTYTFTVEAPVAPLGEALLSLSDASVEKTYVLYNPANTIYAIYDTDQGNKIWAAGGRFGELDRTDAGSSWMLLEKDGSYFLYNMGAKAYLSTPGWPDGVALACRFADSPIALQVVEAGEGKFAFSSTGIEKDYVCAAPDAAPATPQDGERPITIWSADGAGCHWQLLENPNVAADPTVVDQVATGLGSVQAKAITAKGIYTLQGVKLNTTDPSKLAKGLYIIDGQKVLVK